MKKLSVILFAFIALFPYQPLQAQENGQQFGNWVIECFKISENNQACGLSSSVFLKDSGALLSKITLIEQIINNKKTLVVTILLPHNLYLPAGVDVKIDAGQQYKINFHTCTKSSCEAQGFVGEDLKTAMRKGNGMVIGYVDVVQLKPIKFTMPLNGVTAGLRALNVQ